MGGTEPCGCRVERSIRVIVGTVVVGFVGTPGRAGAVGATEDEGAVEVEDEEFTGGGGSGEWSGRLFGFDDVGKGRRCWWLWLWLSRSTRTRMGTSGNGWTINLWIIIQFIRVIVCRRFQVRFRFR